MTETQNIDARYKAGVQYKTDAELKRAIHNFGILYKTSHPLASFVWVKLYCAGPCNKNGETQGFDSSWLLF